MIVFEADGHLHGDELCFMDFQFHEVGAANILCDQIIAGLDEFIAFAGLCCP